MCQKSVSASNILRAKVMSVLVWHFSGMFNDRTDRGTTYYHLKNDI